ncbi:TonB-dependent siderophore receptor [Oceanicaulis sp. MMSF_3324]|uniref:TonB-dependent receptor plug domain-containing protein n=1 Tax=Oceanicaulis sp. MMSF_3324 TaxID=3046702 RepID=UPI00273D4910|nr:TonB-dependent receptor [Oceanicaulis sp. MMSF_3324]
MLRNKALARKLLCTSMLSGFAAMVAMPAAAVAQEESASQDVIQVTGSRIQRPDVTAPSPITSIDETTLEVNNTINIEDTLNDLPQLIPAFDASSNNPGNGTATLSLRGLGASRTLILVDGRRMVGEGQGGIVNVNSIPSALLERVDIVTGGASAVYGSDAVAGVVNFIIKDDFEGVEFDVSSRWTEQGGAGNFTSSLTMGGNFDQDRGNAVLSISYNDRESLLQGQRDFSRDTLIDNGSGTFGTTGSINIPNTLILSPGFSTSFDPSVAPGYAQNINDRCANLGGSGAGGCWGFGVFVDENGSVQPFRSSGAPNDRYNYAPTNYLQLPQERFNIASFVTYDINENIEVYSRAFYTNTIVDSQLAPTPGGTQFLFTVDENNPFLTGELRALFDANSAINVGDIDGDGVGEYQFTTGRRYQEIATRNDLRDTNTYVLGGGLRGAINQDWNYDVYAQYGTSRFNRVQTGNVSISAVQAVVEEGRWNIFGGPNTLTPELVDEISRTGAIVAQNEQISAVATVDGMLNAFQSPWASSPLGVAAGIEYRSEYIKRTPDSVLGPDVMGFNQSTPIEGSYDVYEVFGEANLPLAEGMQFAEYLALNAGYRYSDYSSVGTVESYFAGAEWIPVDSVRFRAQFQRAVRAPSIGDLFQSDSNGFPGVQDPCSNSSSGAFNLLSPEQQQTALQNCVQDGAPSAAPVSQLNSQVESIFRGATQLEAEEADTFTIGVQYSPEFLPGLEFTVDYYDIEIANALGGATAQQVVNDCILNGNQAACAITQRSAGGVLTLFGERPGTDPNGDGISQALTTENQTGLFVEGWDYGVTYSVDPNWDFGSLRFGINGTLLETNSFQPTASLGVIECKGFYGADCGEPTPEHKFLAFGTWMYGPLTATLRWSHIGEMTDVQTQFYGAYADGLDVTSIDSFDYFDLNANYQLTDSINLYGGIRNVFEQEPPRLGDGPQSEQANTWPATYDPYGRQFFIGLTARY